VSLYLQLYREAQEPDDDAPNFRTLRWTRRIARKEHTCTYCRAAIRVGEPYRDYAWISDGEFEAGKTHTVCPRQGDVPECDDPFLEGEA